MTDVELIVSANGCTDNTWDYLQQQFVSVGMADHLQILWSDQPLGYSGANNLAIKLAKGQRIVLLNNDLVFLPQERNFWIRALNQPFEINP
jgi:GT2 family glycosyltransferase